MKLSRIICAFTGHVPRTKMSCIICDRCRYVLANQYRMPSGIRVVHKDGSKHVARVGYVGEAEGRQVWRIVSPLPAGDIGSVEVDYATHDCLLILDTRQS